MRAAREAESLGYDSLWTTDHVLMASDQPEPYGAILEAAVTLAYIAAVTERVRLGVSVLIVTQREPVLVAKQAATLDVLSDGRLILGLGAGWNEREFNFLGADFRSRGRRLDEYILAMRTLWSDADPRFDGQFVRFADVSFEPRPVQPGGPPIWLGGSSHAALRRAALLCDGWHAVGMPVEQFAAGMATIRKLAPDRPVVGSIRLRTTIGRTLPQQRGASGTAQSQLAGPPERIMEQIHAYAEAGASELVLFFGANDLEANLEDMRGFAEQVRARL